MNNKNRKKRKPTPNTSWDPLARWYDGWMGQDGGRHHRQLAIPAILELADPRSGEHILDVGCGQGVLAPYIARIGAQYTGVDISPQLLHMARKRHGRRGRFLHGDARRLRQIPGLRAASFDAVVFLLSIQDMEPLAPVLASAAWALKPGGRLALLMTHPCFRVPRQSGWGWDDGRKLQFRRVDRYLTPLAVPLKPYPGQKKGVSRSFHRPLSLYISGLVACGMSVTAMCEIPAAIGNDASKRNIAQRRAREEIPLFLGLRADKLHPGQE